MDIASDSPSFLQKSVFQPSQRFKQNIFVFLCVVVLNAAIYSNTLDVPFQYDDLKNIVEKTEIYMKKLTWSEIEDAIFSNPARAVPMLSFAFNYYFGNKEKLSFEDNENPIGFHVVNISIHIITSFFLFLFMHNTLMLPAMKDNYGSHAFAIAIVATFLWSVNPVNTQAVTYIVQRMASMAAMFYIISMYCYVKARTSFDGQSKQILYCVCFLSFILAFFSKQNAAMLPVSLILYEFIIMRRIFKEDIYRHKKAILIAMFIIISLFGVTLLLSTKSPFSFFSESYEKRMFTLSQRVLTQPRIILFYISLLLYPSPERLNLGHDIAWSHSLFNPITTLPAIFMIGILICGALFWNKKYPLIAFCTIFFFFNHAIESSIIALEMIFEHRNYLPSMLFFVPISIGLVRGIEFFSSKLRMQTIIAAFIVCLIIGFAHGTYIRNFAWKTQKSLWLDAVNKAPGLTRNHVNIGVEYLEEKDLPKAIHHFQTAIKLDTLQRKKNRFRAYALLGDCYREMGENEKAIQIYHIANNLNPIPRTYLNLSVAYLNMGNFDAARQSLITSLSMEKMKEAHNNLGYILLRQKEFLPAISELKKALEMDHTLSGSHLNIGIAYKETGHLQKAAYHLKIALATNPHQKALNNGRINAYLGLIETYKLMKNETGLRYYADQFLQIMLDSNIKKPYKIIKRLNASDYIYRDFLDAQIILLGILEGIERRDYQLNSIKKSCQKLLDSL